MAGVHLTKMSQEERERRAVQAHWRTKGISYTLDEYNEALEDQAYCCAICRKHKDSFKHRLSVDHDHSTNEVRGLLCQRCNLLVGFCSESIGILESAIKYLSPYVYLEATETEEDIADGF